MIKLIYILTTFLGLWNRLVELVLETKIKKETKHSSMTGTWNGRSLM